jgi:drug/metabolite transporter (DMT)-like permease
MNTGGQTGWAWTFVGVGAAGLLALALGAHYLASRRRARNSTSVGGCVLVIVAAFALAIYAVAIRQWVFLAAQVFFLLLGIRQLLAAVAFHDTVPREIIDEHGSSLPVVSPDSAERKRTDT